ncbi:Protein DETOXIFICATION 48, partial [Cucurbita argyrosperma subsp. sororia]
MGSDMGLCYEIQRWNIFYKGNKGKTGPCAAAAAAAAASSRTIQSCRLVDDAMCNPKPSSPNNSSFLTPNYKANFMATPNKSLDNHNLNNKNNLLKPADDQLAQLHRFPTVSEAVEEMKEIGKISGPTAITGLLLYSRAMISMLFLGYLGELELAAGSLSIGFANITGYSVLSGLAMGMEPICGQAYGAKQWKLLGITLQRAVLLLLTSSVPISFMWLNMRRILLWCGQDEQISSMAQTFILFSIPDLIFLSLLHPLRIYLRTQSITLPLTYCSAFSVLLHIPLNFLLVVHFKMGISGVAIAMIWFNFNVFFFLVSFVYFSGVYKDSWVSPTQDCLHGWAPLLSLAIPTCVSVCLEWWWYEFMIMLCGLLVNPKATIASMGILIQTTSLVYVFPSSLSLGVSTRVGNELGANRPAKARLSMIVSLLCAAVLGVLAMVFTTLIRHKWGRFFTNDTEILELTSVALPIVGLCELGNCPQTTGCGVLRGTARPTIGANINLGSFYLVGFPVAIIMGFAVKLGFAGLWIGLLAAQGSCALMMIYVLSTTDWIAQAERAMQLTKAGSSNCNPPLLPLSSSSEDDQNIKKIENLEEILCSNHETDLLLPTTTTKITVH